MSADVYDVDLDIGLPLTMNLARTMHHRTYGKRIKAIRETTAAAAAHIGPLGRCEVLMHYRPADRRRRDADGLVATLKPVCDGLVDAGLVVDDTPDLMTKHMPVIEPAARPFRVWLTITRLPLEQ